MEVAVAVAVSDGGWRKSCSTYLTGGMQTITHCSLASLLGRCKIYVIACFFLAKLSKAVQGETALCVCVFLQTQSTVLERLASFQVTVAFMLGLSQMLRHDCSTIWIGTRLKTPQNPRPCQAWAASFCLRSPAAISR